MAYFTTLYSGSSGNCALIRSDDKYLLIDMGKSCRTTLTALKSLGLAVSDCVGILVTHEHSDHVSGLDTFLKKHPVPLYGCADTLDTLASRGTIPPAVEAIPVDGQTLEIGSFTVTSFPTSHDVPCCGYRIRTADGHVMALATDLDRHIDRFEIQGTKGSIKGTGFEFNGDGELSYTITFFDGREEMKTISVPQNYRLEVEQMGRCVEGKETPAVTRGFSLANARMIDAILEEIGY